MYRLEADISTLARWTSSERKRDLEFGIFHSSSIIINFALLATYFSFRSRQDSLGNIGRGKRVRIVSFWSFLLVKIVGNSFFDKGFLHIRKFQNEFVLENKHIRIGDKSGLWLIILNMDVNYRRKMRERWIMLMISDEYSYCLKYYYSLLFRGVMIKRVSREINISIWEKNLALRSHNEYFSSAQFTYLDSNAN